MMMMEGGGFDEDELMMMVASAVPDAVPSASLMDAGLVKPGEWMLIHGVAGGTCQWAAQVGFRCHSPTSLSHAAEFLRL